MYNAYFRFLVTRWTLQILQWSLVLIYSTAPNLESSNWTAWIKCPNTLMSIPSWKCSLIHMISYLRFSTYGSPLSLFNFIVYLGLPQSISQTVYNVHFSMLAQVVRLDPKQLLHLSLSNSSTLCIPYFLISHFTLCSHVF